MEIRLRPVAWLSDSDQDLSPKEPPTTEVQRKEGYFESYINARGRVDPSAYSESRNETNHKRTAMPAETATEVVSKWRREQGLFDRRRRRGSERRTKKGVKQTQSSTAFTASLGDGQSSPTAD